MFGGGETQAQTQTVASGVDIQSSCYGGVVPVIYGRARLTGNLIWYGDFQAIPVQSSSANGGKGGDSGHGSTSYDYKASFIFALGEGTLADVQNVWASKTKTAFDKSNLGFANGDPGQAPWGYLTTKFSDKAMSYAGTGYVYAMAYDLGQSAQMPNLSYEVTGIGANAIGGLPDADPGAVVSDVLTNPRYGVGFPTARIPSGGFTIFSNYCRAAGLMISPVFDTQSDAAGQLNAIVQSCNSEFVWSGSLLSIVPYGDQDLFANGASYTAPSAPVFSLTDDDFLYEQGQDPVQCSRARPSDQMNAIRFEFLDRAHSYNGNIVEAKNQATIEAYGLRGEQPEQMHHFCDAGVAKKAATLKLQRQSVRNVYSFTLGWRYCLLDPMDIVEITDSGLGLDRQWVRILSLEEDENGNIKVTAEEYLGGTGHAPLYDFEPGSPYDVDYNVLPGNVNEPLIFEPPPVMLAARSITAPQIMVGASGGANWGGCDVYLSLDDVTFKRMGRITAPSRQGALANTLASAADPDTTHTLSIDMSQSGRALGTGVTSPVHSDADAFRTLCYVDGELIAYDQATLTGSDLYALTYLRRGVYNTTISAHATGSKFCRLDESVKSFDLPVTPVSYVGKTLHLKFLSYNIYGGGQQELSDVASIPYVPGGSGVFVFPPTGVSFTVGAEQQKDGSWISFGVVAWTASPDPLFDQYEVQWRLHTGPGAWTSLRIGPDTTSHRISPLPNNTAYDVQVRAVRTSGPFYSAWAQTLNVTTAGKTAAPPAPTALSVIGGYRQITVKWTASAENDIAWYEIWEGASNVLGSATRIALVNATHYMRPGLNLSDTRFYWVRAQDTSGNFSAYLGPGSATTNAVDASDITGQIVNSQIAANAITASNLINGLEIVQIVTAIGLADHTVSHVAYVTTTSQLYNWNGSAWVIPTAAAAAGSITTASFASGITPVQIVSSLASIASPVEGMTAFLTTDGKLHRYHAGAWTIAVDGPDITANSITGGQIAAAAIDTQQLAAGAVTASILSVDTANMLSDPLFNDAIANGFNGTTDYWSQALTAGGAAATIWTIKGPTTPSAISMQVQACASVTSTTITGTTGTRITSSYIQIDPTQAYRLQGLFLATGSGVSASAQTIQLEALFYDGSKTFLGSINGTAYSANAANPMVTAVLSFGDTGNPSAPSTAVSVRWSAHVFTNGDVTNPVNWFVALPAVRLGVSGVMIQNGAVTADNIAVNTITATQIAAGTITAAQIAAGGITATNIAAHTLTAATFAANSVTAAAILAGTITGDRMDANFIDSNVFSTTHGAGQPFIEINGKTNTVGGHQNGPWFKVNDGNHDRVFMGQLQDAWGLWIRDATGALFFEEASLSDGVVLTSHLAANAAAVPGAAAIPDSTYAGSGAWVTIASVTLTTNDACKMLIWANILQGYPSGPRVTGCRIKHGSTVLASSGGPGSASGFNGTPTISVEADLATAVTNTTFTLEWWGEDGNAVVDGGSFMALGVQR